jgi:acyl-CoA dehydrogenase
MAIAKSELARYQAVEGWPSEHVPTRLAIAKQRFAHLPETGA